MNRANPRFLTARVLVLGACAVPLVVGAQAPPRQPDRTQQQINAANQIANGNSVVHDAAWILSGILPTQATGDAVDAAAAANSGRGRNPNVSGVRGASITPGQIAGSGDVGAAVVGTLGSDTNERTILGNAALRNALIENANQPNNIRLPTDPVARTPQRPPGIYTTPLDGTAPQLIMPQVMTVNGQRVVMVGDDGRLTDAGVRVLQQQNAAADAQLNQYMATREERLAAMRAQNAREREAAAARNNPADSAANAAGAATTEPITPSIGDGPDYPLARQRTRTPRPAADAAGADAAAAAASIGEAIQAALEAQGTDTGDTVTAGGDGEPRMPWDEYAGELSDETLGALIAGANLGTLEGLLAALDTGCPGAPCGSADAFARGPYDQSQLPSVRSGPLPMFQVGDVPTGQTMSVAELLPIYAGYDPFASGTVMRSLDLFPPGPSSVGWSLDLYPPTGVSSVGWSLDLFPPTGISSVGWSLDLYPPTGMSLAGNVLWSELNGNGGRTNGSLVNAFNPLLNSAWNGPGSPLTALELAAIQAGLLDNPNRVSSGATRVGNLTGMTDDALLRLAATDVGGLRSLLAQPFNVLLTWGAGAYDLDLHMTGPLGGDRFHVYFSDRGGLDAAPFAELIRDCICTNGSEVILTSNLLQGGVYRVSVFNYGEQSATSTQLGSPGANVQLSIVRGGTAVGVGQGTTIQGGRTIFSGAPSAGQGNTWRAVEIDPANGRIFFVNDIVQSGSSDSVQ